MFGRIAIVAAVVAASTTLVSGVAQAVDTSDDNGKGGTGTSEQRSSGLGGNLQGNGFGRYLSDPEQFYYGSEDVSPSATDSGSDAESGSQRNDNKWDEGLDDKARGGKGGKAGTNSARCEMTLGPGMRPKQCTGGSSSQDGADGEARSRY